MAGLRNLVLGAGVAALLLSACSELAFPKLVDVPIVTCQDPPTMTTTDASGREINVPVRLTCAVAVAAARGVAGSLAATSIEFRYGNACPGMMSCPFAGPDRGHVIFHGTSHDRDQVVSVWVDDRGLVHADPPVPFPSDGV
jgi:hypothetical protein